LEKIVSKWGISPEGYLAKPSDGGFGVVTESGVRVSMWEEQAYFMEALKAAWEIHAGLIPGQPMKEYTRRLIYTSTDYDTDGEHAKDEAYQTIFNARQFEAMSYHLQMSNPRLNNWAELSFIWY
jgi:hypothetical protein